MFGKKKKNAATVTVKEEPKEEDRKYKMIFKCSLCGKIFTSNEDFAIGEMGVGDSTHQMHYCENGDIGRLEFLGLRPKDKITEVDSDITTNVENDEENNQEDSD